MASITLGGNPADTNGSLPKVGSIAPNFTLTASDLTSKSLSDLGGVKKILNIFPSVGTGVCSASARKFNEEASNLKNNIVFFQWEIDGTDGTTLALSAEGQSTATLRYGSWASRADDVVRTVTLPYVLDPAADGRSVADSEYYTIQLSFDEVSADSVVIAEIR